MAERPEPHLGELLGLGEPMFVCGYLLLFLKSDEVPTL